MRQCVICNEPIKLRGTHRRYCSRECYLKREKPTATMTCAHCKRTVTMLPHRAKVATYCSDACRIAALTKNTVTAKCKVCGKPVKKIGSNNRQFCSYECMGKSKREGEFRKCAHCGKKVYVQPCWLKRYTRFYCDNSCRLMHQYQSTGVSWEKYLASSTEYRQLRDRAAKWAKGQGWNTAVMAKHKVCSMCKKAKPEVVHHKIPMVKIIVRNDFDYDRIIKDPLLLDPKNGTGLCTVCHEELHKFRPSAEKSAKQTARIAGKS